MPTWEGFLVPVLKVLSAGEALTARELQDQVAEAVGPGVKLDEDVFE